MTNRAASASEDMDIQGFLDKKDDTGGGKFFSMNFNEQDEFRVWLHKTAPINTVWRSVWPTLSDDGKKVRLARWTSMEAPAILNKLRYKLDDGSFEHSPTTDPFMLLCEWVNQQIAAGKIDFADEIFKWELEGDEEDKVIHAGGFTGQFLRRDLDEDEEKAMRKIGVRQREAYKEDCRPNEEYIFIFVDNEKPEAGAQICTLKRGPAKAFQKCVNDRSQRFTKDKEKGKLSKYPVCFVFSKDASKEGPPKYIVAETDDELTEEIEAALDGEYPDTGKITAPTNVAMLRESFEKHWCHDEVPDWDAIFDNAFEKVKGTPAAELPTSFNHGANAESEGEEKEEKKPAKTATKKAAPPPEEDGAECDACGKMIPESILEGDRFACPHCGAEYEKKGDEYVLKPKAEEKPKIRASRRRTEEAA